MLKTRLAAAPLAACLALCWTRPAPSATWDRDVAAMAETGPVGVTSAIVGRFDQFPEEFYAARLNRLIEKFQNAGVTFEEFDDLAVASARLGNIEGAFSWIGEKEKAIDAAERDEANVAEARFRTLSNKATLHLERWRAAGSPGDDLADPIAARDLLKKALALNPDPPLGREPVELLLAEWIVEANQPDSRDAAPARLADRWEAAAREEFGAPTGPLPPAAIDRDEARWLALAATTSARPDVDVMDVVGATLKARGDFPMQCVAATRCEELIDGGAESFSPNAPKGAKLKNLMGLDAVADPSVQPLMRQALRIAYRDLRGAAAAWRRHREKFLAAGLRENRHPDADSRFWNDYKEVAQVRWRREGEPSYGSSGLLVDATGSNAMAEQLEARYRREALVRLAFALSACALFACGVVAAVMGGRATRGKRPKEAKRRR